MIWQLRSRTLDANVANFTLNGQTLIISGSAGGTIPTEVTYLLQPYLLRYCMSLYLKQCGSPLIDCEKIRFPLQSLRTIIYSN